MRMLNARLIEQAKAGTISEETATNAASPLRKLKSVFPNSTLNKHTPMDVYLTPPSPNRPRALVIRDLGSIENDWVATELVLSYFGETGPSPPVCALALICFYAKVLLVEEDCFRQSEGLPKVKVKLPVPSIYFYINGRPITMQRHIVLIKRWIANPYHRLKYETEQKDYHLIFFTCWSGKNACHSPSPSHPAPTFTGVQVSSDCTVPCPEQWSS